MLAVDVRDDRDERGVVEEGMAELVRLEHEKAALTGPEIGSASLFMAEFFEIGAHDDRGIEAARNERERSERRRCAFPVRAGDRDRAVLLGEIAYRLGVGEYGDAVLSC